MKRIHLILLFSCIGLCTLNAQEKRLSKTIVGTSYEDLSVGFRQLDNSYLVIREGDKITYSYYVKDGEEVLDGPFTYTTQTKPQTELIERQRSIRYHYKYPSPVIQRKETVKGSFSNGKCDGQWSWTTTVNNEENNYIYYSYVGKMTRCYKEGNPDGQWSLTLDMKAREGTNYKKESFSYDGTFSLGSYLPDKKIYHFAYSASFQDGELSMKTDDGEIQNGKRIINYPGGVTFSDEDIDYILKQGEGANVYLYKDSTRYEVRCFDYAGDFTELPIFQEDVRIGGHSRGDYFGFLDSKYLGSSLFYPAWNWGEHWIASSYRSEPYVDIRSTDKIVPLDRKEASQYLNEKGLRHFEYTYILNMPLSKEDHDWAVAALDSTERSIEFEKELKYAKKEALRKVEEYKPATCRLVQLSFYDKDGRYAHLPDDLTPKCEFNAEKRVSKEFEDGKAEVISRIDSSCDLNEIDSLVNCMGQITERAERYKARYKRFNEEVGPALQKEFPRIIPTYIVDPKSKKTVGLTSSYYPNGWDDQARELLFVTRKFDKLVYTVFWNTLIYVKENINESVYETSADYYEAYYTKQVTLAKYFYENYKKAKKFKTCEELLAAAGVTL